MKRRDFLEKWGLSSLKINIGFLDAEFSPSDPDRNAAWDLYIELLTRTATQSLASLQGDDKTALESLSKIFPLTREILREHGSGCGEFAKIAIPVLNQFLRPFLTKWHRHSIDGTLSEKENSIEFRKDLSELQALLRNYSQALAAMAGVEDLTILETIEADGARTKS